MNIDHNILSCEEKVCNNEGAHIEIENGICDYIYAVCRGLQFKKDKNDLYRYEDFY